MKLAALSPTAILVWMAFASSAQAVCLPNVLPMFSSLAFANGSEQQDCEPVPVQSTTLGSSLVGSADATGSVDASLRLHAIVHADYTDPFPNEGVSGGEGEAGFQDQFRALFPGTGPAFLTFTLNLTGSIATDGMGAQGSVNAGMSAADNFFNTGGAQLIAPGTTVFQLEIFRGADELIRVGGDLTVVAGVSAPGNVAADFSNTFAVTKIQLLDGSGNLLEDNITLKDDAGNVLGGPPNQPPPPPAVPEPSSALLLAAGLGLLAFAYRRVRVPLIGAIA